MAVSLQQYTVAHESKRGNSRVIHCADRSPPNKDERMKYIWESYLRDGYVLGRSDEAFYKIYKTHLFDARADQRRSSNLLWKLTFGLDELFDPPCGYIIDNQTKGNNLLVDSCNHKSFFRNDMEAIFAYRNLVYPDRIFRHECGLPQDRRMVINDSSCINNAFWTPYDRCIYIGQTDKTLYSEPWCMNPDIVAHEYGHSIVNRYAALNYQFQSGALNESIADITAIISKHYRERSGTWHPTLCDWSIAPGLILNDSKLGAIRSIADPGSAWYGDEQPKHMDNYKQLPLEEDYGGVHDNSGIPSHAFYLFTTNLGWKSYEQPRSIWMSALFNCDSRNTDFATFAGETIREMKRPKIKYEKSPYANPRSGETTGRVVAEIPRYSYAEINALRQAWHAVGVIPRE